MANRLKEFLAVGECMVELAEVGPALYARGFAGDTFNAAWYAKKLLPADWRISYLSAVGDDRISAEMLAFMRGAGIETEWVRQIAGGSPGLYMISLQNGERSFSYWRESSAARRLAQDGATLAQAFEQADVISFSGITLAILPPEDGARLIAAAAAARQRGAIVAFDTNFRPRLWQGRQDGPSLFLAAAAAASIVLPGRDDEMALFGEDDLKAIARRYQRAGAALVVIKDGANGVTIFDGGKTVSVPAAKPSAVVDTTAAGDSFAAAFLAQFAQGASAEEAARFAVRIAAQVVAQRGALVDIAAD